MFKNAAELKRTCPQEEVVGKEVKDKAYELEMEKEDC